MFCIFIHKYRALHFLFLLISRLGIHNFLTLHPCWKQHFLINPDLVISFYFIFSKFTDNDTQETTATSTELSNTEMENTSLAMDTSHRQLQLNRISTGNHNSIENNKRQPSMNRRQQQLKQTSHQNIKSTDSNCYSIKFIRYILHTFNVMFFVSILEVFSHKFYLLFSCFQRFLFVCLFVEF